MKEPASSDGRAGRRSPDTGFRRLVWTTIAATFTLIVVGGVVRVSDSGLGCGPAGSGLQGWPLCRGDVLPGLELNTLIEYAHRALGSVVGLLMISIAVLAWRRHRENRPLLWATGAAAVLVVAQGLLGAATVEANLEPGLVAAHLGMAMILLGLLLFVRRAEGGHETGAGGGPPARVRSLRPLALAASLAVLATVVAGGYMAGTEKYGRTDYIENAGAHYACGNDFPACNGAFLPFGQSYLADVHLTHRVFIYLSMVLVLALVALVVRRRPSPGAVRNAWVAFGLFWVQMALGALNVWIPDQYEALIVAHLAVGTLLWASLVSVSLRVFRVAAPARAPAATTPEGGSGVSRPVVA